MSPRHNTPTHRRPAASWMLPAVGWLILLTLLLPTAACGNDGNKEAKHDGKPTIAVTYGPLAYLLREVAGERCDVTVTLPPGANPESYDPTMAELRRLGDCAAYFQMNTPGFEESMASRFKALARSDSARVADVSAGIERIEGTHADDSHGDPHIWNSVRNARTIAANMARELSAIDPAGASYYKPRLDSLTASLDALDAEIASTLKASGNRAFAIQHPSLSYFARDYGLEQIPIESDGKEPSPAQMAERLAYAIGHHPSVMFFEREHNPEQAAELARQIGVPLVELRLNSEDWPQQMRKTAAAIAGRKNP